MEDQICFTGVQGIIGIVASVVAAVGYFNNIIPAPDKIENPLLRIFSRILHFIGTDIRTAVAKKTD